MRLAFAGHAIFSRFLSYKTHRPPPTPPVHQFPLPLLPLLLLHLYIFTYLYLIYPSLSLSLSLSHISINISTSPYHSCLPGCSNDSTESDRPLLRLPQLTPNQGAIPDGTPRHAVPAVSLSLVTDGQASSSSPLFHDSYRGHHQRWGPGGRSARETYASPLQNT
jgi:hypothetical protein